MAVLPRDHPKYNLTVYLTLCQFMADFIEDKVVRDPLYKQKIKFLTKQLVEALQQPVDRLFRMQMDDGEGFATEEHLTQFEVAANAMEHFFKLSMQIEDLEPVRKQGLITQLNILLLSYGLETMDVPINY